MAPAPAESQANPFAALSELDAERRRSVASRRPPPPRKRPARAAWLGLVLFVAVLGAVFVLGRQQIVAMAPATIKLYDLVGLGERVIGEGLDLRDVVSSRRVVDGERVLVIQGAVVNVSDQAREVPRLRASLSDTKGVELTHWTFAAESPSLQPGEKTSFETTAKNPPREGALNLAFTTED